jgi:hypothetical protein
MGTMMLNRVLSPNSEADRVTGREILRVSIVYDY